MTGVQTCALPICFPVTIRYKNKYQDDKTDETYRLPNGAKSALPIYYRNKIYTDEEKEKLWLNKLDKQERYINGTKISVKNGEELYYKVQYRDWETNKNTPQITKKSRR